jgi:hypothetical protein
MKKENEITKESMYEWIFNILVAIFISITIMLIGMMILQDRDANSYCIDHGSDYNTNKYDRIGEQYYIECCNEAIGENKC